MHAVFVSHDGADWARGVQCGVYLFASRGDAREWQIYVLERNGAIVRAGAHWRIVGIHHEEFSRTEIVAQFLDTLDSCEFFHAQPVYDKR